MTEFVIRYKRQSEHDEWAHKRAWPTPDMPIYALNNVSDPNPDSTKNAYRKPGAVITETFPCAPGYDDLVYYPQFTAVGTNHRVKDHLLMRDIPDLTWYVEITSLDDLLRIHQYFGKPIIISKDIYDQLTIIIDDTDRDYEVYHAAVLDL